MGPIVTGSFPRPAGTAKGRVLATLDVIRQAVNRLPDPACRILEESHVLTNLRMHLETVSNASAAWEAAAPFVKDLSRLAGVASRAIRKR